MNSPAVFIMASQWQCRLCLSNVLSNHRVSLMSKTGKKQDWIQRIVNLLGVQVASDDSLPQHICAKCCRRVEKLEKCAIDLESFQLQASQSYKTLLDQRSQSESHKRPKETSGAAVDLTPDTLRERPPAKRGVGMRKRLDFGQESFDLCRKFSSLMHTKYNTHIDTMHSYIPSYYYYYFLL